MHTSHQLSKPELNARILEVDLGGVSASLSLFVSVQPHCIHVLFLLFTMMCLLNWPVDEGMASFSLLGLPG